jgi:hypothetical protein
VIPERKHPLSEFSSFDGYAQQVYAYNYASPHQILKEDETCCTVDRTFASAFLLRLELTYYEPHTLYVAGDSL